MLNQLHRRLHRPERGWDPIRPDHARAYAEEQWGGVDVRLVERLESAIGGLSGKCILDLGGGPGQYSVAFARRGAVVTWHDVSDTYRKLAESKARDAGVPIRFSLGYLEDAIRLPAESFDLVFCRLAWSYCVSDRAFARSIFALIRPGMWGYVDCNTPGFAPARTFRQRLAYFMDERLGWKIGHPYPPHGRIARLLLRYPIEYMELNYMASTNDKITFRKAKVDCE